MTSTAEDRLLAPYRAVRRVAAGDGSPWSGLLVRLASGESRILVDGSGFDADWAGWSSPPEGNVLAPLDVVRRADGHDVMLPLCIERVTDFLARRAAGRVPLSLGETVTLGVSLTRGIAAWTEAEPQSGEWWLTEEGRPLLVPGSSDLDAAVHTGELLDDLARGSEAGEALHFAASAARGAQGGMDRAAHDLRSAVHDLRDAEDELFAIAAAEPLATTVLGPRSAREVVAFDRPPVRTLDEEPRRPSWLAAITRHVDDDLADTVSRATTGVWRRVRGTGGGTGRRSRRPWVLAGGAAALVLAAGLLWPSGGPDTATAEGPGGASTYDVALVAPTADETAHPSATVTAEGTAPIDEEAPLEGAAAPPDLVGVVDRLLAARSTCGADEGCLADVSVDPTSALASGVIDLDPSQRETTLLDEFGGVAVLRVDAVGAAMEPQLVVIMLQDDRWLLRDVHIAQQP